LKKNTIDLDFGAVTPGTFCIKIRIKKALSGYSQSQISEEIVALFNEYFDGLGHQIEYVNPVFKMKELLECHQ